jgi:hypothetical protein
MSQKESCHGYHSDKAEEEEEDDENVTRSDLVSEVVPLTFWISEAPWAVFRDSGRSKIRPLLFWLSGNSAVIPDRNAVASPESIITVQELWISSAISAATLRRVT